MNETLNTMLTRRSCRTFKAEQVREEHLEKILEAGTYAANGRGRQAGKIVVVQDAKTIEQLRAMNAAILGAPDTDPFYGAPTICIVLANSEVRTWVEDGSLVMGNLMLAAEAVGVGACWIHRAREEFDSPEGKALLKKWGISENYRGIGHCILGYADCDMPAAPARRGGNVFWAE